MSDSDKRSANSQSLSQSTNDYRLTQQSFAEFDESKLREAEKELTQRVIKTQKDIRRVDFFSAVCAFVTLALALLLVGIILDCWILSEGFSEKGRVYYAILGSAITLVFFVWRLVPVFNRRINALYAAKVLEDAWQDKHNFTINWLQLCKLNGKSPNSTDYSTTSETGSLSALRGVAVQAAANAQNRPLETVIDCTGLIRWGIALAVVVAIGAVYVIATPKNPFAAAGRIVAPLAKIERPQALRFKSVEPGDAIAYQGDFIDISADIPGANSYTVELLYSTDDGRLTDVPVPMEQLGNSKFSVAFPPEESGLNENLTYRLLVGRGKRIESYSETYRIEVRPQPSFRVEKTTLTFPEYTGLAPQTFENQGDVRAVEGTNVEIVARCNADLTRAVLLPDGSNPRAQKMTIDTQNPQLASINFPLEWAKDVKNDGDISDPRQEFNFYQLVSHDVDGQENRDRPKYTVSILPDLPPTIRWNPIPDEVVEVPVNDVLRVKLIAEDPDFSIRSVKVAFSFREENNGSINQSVKQVPNPIELTSSVGGDVSAKTLEQGPVPYVGVNAFSCEISPEKLGLAVGDELVYWGTVLDSKLPEPNQATTEKRTFIVAPPTDNPSLPSAEEEQDQNDGEQQDGTGNQQGENPNADGQNEGDNNSNKTGQDGQSDQGQSENQTETGGKSAQGESGENSEANGSQESGESSNGNPDENQGENGSEESNGSNSQSENGANQSASAQSNGDPSGDNSNEQEGPKDEGNANGEGGSNKTSLGQGQEDANPSKPDESQVGLGNQQTPSPSGSDGAQSSTEVFETILDYMRDNGLTQDEQNDGPASDRTQTEDSSNQNRDGTGQGQNGKGQPSPQEEQPPFPSDEEVNPNFNSNQDLPKPNEKRQAPTRTSSEKPDENSPSYQAEHPDKLDPSTRRQQGEPDPNTNDFLANNANPNDQETNPNGNNQDANITFDPLDQREAVAGDEVNPNAAEAKGASGDVPPDAPFEIDQDQRSNGENASNNDNQVDLNDVPEGLQGAGGNSPSNENGEPTQKQNPDASGMNVGENEPQQKEGEGKSPSNGKSNDNSGHGGGGGGSGLGELNGGNQKLAPADKPNLQYAEEATNLVLNYLEDSLKDKIDKQLLEELGWSEEQLREFLKRWKRMRAAAENGSESAVEAYLKELEKIDLAGTDKLGGWEDDYSPLQRNNPSNLQQGKSANEALRLKTPDRLSERVRIFTQGVSQDNR